MWSEWVCTVWVCVVICIIWVESMHGVCVCVHAWVSICCLVPLTGGAAGELRLVPLYQWDHQSCCLLLAHPLNGDYVASYGCGKYKYKYKGVYLCMHIVYV